MTFQILKDTGSDEEVIDQNDENIVNVFKDFLRLTCTWFSSILIAI